MSRKKRRIFAVVTATAADPEQREVISGIIAQAQKQNIDIVVLSNIYNPIESCAELIRENDIYNLINSDEYDGFILITESIVNDEVQQKIRQYIGASDIPIIAVGSVLDGLDLPHFHYINTDDVQDFVDITTHLIKHHNYSKIEMLTGYESMPVSHYRAEGFQKALKANGLPFDPGMVHYGNFWLNSGEELAARYINGELSLPEAIVCGNDHMAYGLLDGFMRAGIRVPEHVAVIGYESVHERHFHAPLLTTYKRNRRGLGESAVRMLINKLETGDFGSFAPPSGKIISGVSCGCNIDMTELTEEMEQLRMKKDYDFVNLYNQLDHHLAESRTLTEFTDVCNEFRYQVRNAAEIYFCLYEDWHTQKQCSEMMTCYPVTSDKKPFSMHEQALSSVFTGDAAAYYFSPLFFADRSLGYAVLKYTEPDGYDHIYRNWLKSVSTGLEVLRMKSDIQYLILCQNLSETKDSLTGMLNYNGIERAFQAAITENSNMFLTVLRVCLFHDDFTDVNRNQKIDSLLDAAEAVRRFTGESGICGRISDNTFMILHRGNPSYCDVFSDLLSSFVIQHKKYLKNYGMDSFVCCTVNGSVLSEMETECNRILDEKQKAIRVRHQIMNYPLMLETRNYIYLNPTYKLSIDEVCKKHSYSVGHLRAMYKDCFDISFNQDCISGRIAMAKYLLCLTDMHVSEVSKSCGYHDNKYFIRQFQIVSGFSPNTYRELFQR